MKKLYLKGSKVFPCFRKFFKGFTLVETMVTVLLFAIIIGVVSSVLILGRDSFEVNSIRADLQQSLRNSMNWMTKDLRQTSPASILNIGVGASASSVQFKIPTYVASGSIVWSDVITYSIGGSNSDQLMREGPLTGESSSSGERIIARNISSLTVAHTSSSIVNVSLQAQKTTLKNRQITLNLSFQVRLRNN